MKKTILIAEDGIAIIILLTIVLKRQGYKVIFAQNGKLALNMLTQMCRTGHAPDLLMCNIDLPAIHGEVLIACVRELNIDIPIIAMTDQNNFDLECRLSEQWCASVVQKPFSRETLLERINAIFDGDSGLPRQDPKPAIVRRGEYPINPAPLIEI